MFPDFLPSKVAELTEATSIALAKKIQRTAIATPLHPQPITTAYVRQGRGGIPLVLLHGFDSSMLEFCRLQPLLAARQETWMFDLLGFGFSDRKAGLSVNPASIKTHLYCCWKTLIDRPVILMGASMGGAAAIDFTHTYPEAVRKLILIDSMGYSGSFPIGQFLFPPLDVIAVEFWRQRKLQALNFGHFFGWNSGDLEALRCVSLQMDMPGWREAMSDFTKNGGYDWLGHKIAQIRKPTLILWGDADESLGTADASKFERDLPHSQLIWIENCGHTPQLTHPEITARHILHFSELNSL